MELDDFAFQIIWQEASEIYQELESKGRLPEEIYFDKWEVEEGWRNDEESIL